MSPLSANTVGTPAAAAAIDRMRQLSRYARRALDRDPTLVPLESIELPFGPIEMRAMLATVVLVDEAALWRALRRLRERVMLWLIARDLSGMAGLDEVFATMTALAEIAIDAAINHLEPHFTARYGTPVGADRSTPQKLHVIGMGKLGGRELNVSSDIDLVFAYPEEGETTGSNSLSNHEFFTHLTRRIIAALGETTADGYVFRVDTRLRPWGSDGPLACSFEALEQYFVVHGREWERYAWLKARLLCGDRGREWSAFVQPFVFRRHFDYSAFESLRLLHQEVRADVERRDIADNVKLGPGGIREIEFIAQLFQLVRGGRDTAFRTPSTMKVLPLLSARGLLTPETAQELCKAYIFLRNLEHRLQYLDDRQTHKLPTLVTDQTLIACAMNFADWHELRSELDRHRANVSRRFGALFVTAEAPHPLADLWLISGNEQKVAAVLREWGYGEPQRVLERLVTLRSGQRLRQMPATSRQRLEQIVPLLIAAAAHQLHPEAVFGRLLDLTESIGRREAYLALLLQYPAIIGRVARLAAASPWAATYLTRHPILLDELIDERAPPVMSEWPRLQMELREQLDGWSGDVDRQMDALRHFKHSRIMRLIVADLDGALPLEVLSDHLSALADIILGETLHAVWRTLPAPHRDFPRFAVIAYGKLGGKELDYASDLDLIFLYDDNDLMAAETYARLAQRFKHWLTALTPAGTLYAVDLRLRPDGASGLLVSALEGFEDYQKQHAWTWEHQALTRARYVCGDIDINARFEQIRRTVICRPRDLAILRREVTEMRSRIAAAHIDSGGEFDLKYSRGGLIDVEFIVQYLVLGYAHRWPELAVNCGNLALLKLAAHLGLIDEAASRAAHDTYRSFRQLQHASRLRGEKEARVERGAVAANAAAVQQLWRQVLEVPVI